MEVRIERAEACFANDNELWRRHVESAHGCLTLALEHPDAASGLLRAVCHHAALARQMVREKFGPLDRISLAQGAFITPASGLGGLFRPADVNG